MNSKFKLGTLFAVISAVTWGTYGTFANLLANFQFSGGDTAIIVSLSMSIFFFIKILLRNPQLLKLELRQFVLLFVVGITGIVLSTYVYIEALDPTVGKVPVAVGSVMTFLNYFLVVIAARFLWKSKITSTKIIAGIISIIGVALILDVFGQLSITMLGLVLMIFVIIGFAASYVLCNQNVQWNYDYDVYLFYTNFFGLIILSFCPPFATYPGVFIHDLVTNVSTFGGPAILSILGMALIPSVACYITLLLAFENLEASLVVLIYTLDPVTAAILGLVVLGQKLNGWEILGMILVLGSLLWVQLVERANEKKQLATDNSTSGVDA